MKVSLKTAQYYSGGQLNLDDIDGLVAKIGAQLGAVEEVVDYGARYEGILVAKVLKSEKHPNADKLSVCEIDAGTMENIQVVCGAPNVREGLTVAWIPPGVTVPATYDKDPFVLEAREIRGVVSNGMLASTSELGINSDHDGILEISADDVGEDNTKPGTPFKNLYGLNDVVLDIENKMFTHRPDCFGVLGVAREIAGIYGRAFETPDWYQKIPKIFLNSSDKQDINVLSIEVKNEMPDQVPRFMAVAMSDVKIGPSPIWVQALLTRVGIKPINNIVDITNHLAYVTGQPLHAYDYDKVKDLSNGNATLIVRPAKKGDKLKLLNGKEIEPVEGTILIATDKEPIGIGGVMGGTSTEVDENTKNIIIECANFAMYPIRRASMAHGLFTDAVTRFNKGQSLLQNDRVIAKMLEDAVQIAGGAQASNFIDLRNFDEQIYNDQSMQKPVVATADFINARLGLNLPKEEIMTLVRNVGFACLEQGEAGEIEFHAPFWRTDIEAKEDIVEEIGRLHGYDKLPVVLPKKDVAPAVIEPKLTLKQSIRTKLSALGANEVLTYSFIPSELIKKAGQDEALGFKITNALSPELQYYRLSIAPNLLTHVHQNIKLGYNNFAIFEIGKVHSNSEIGEDNIPSEFGRVSLVFADKDSKKSAYFVARKYLDELGGHGFKFVPFAEELTGGHKLMTQMLKPFEPKRSAIVLNNNDLPVGVVGEFTSSAIKHFKLPKSCAGFEMFLSAFEATGTSYQPLSRFPYVTQDVCLEVEASLNFSELETAVDEKINATLGPEFVYAKQLIDIFSDEKLSGKKRITFRLSLVSHDRTLDENIMNQFVAEVVEGANQAVGAKQI